MTYRIATAADVDAIMDLEAECLPHPWVRDDIKALTEDPMKAAFLAEEDGEAAGYVGFSFVADECEIGNICVGSKFRRRGIASALLENAFGYLRDKGITTVFLEVAESNKGAFELYRKAGFEHYHTREKYYGDEDAYLCRKFL